jgi:hypothetical protein
MYTYIHSVATLAQALFLVVVVVALLDQCGMAHFSPDHMRAWCVRWVMTSPAGRRVYRPVIYVDFTEMRDALADAGYDVEELLSNGTIWRGYGLIDRCDCWYNDYYNLIQY